MWVLYWLKKQHYFFFFIMSNHEHQEVKDTFLVFVFFSYDFNLGWIKSNVLYTISNKKCQGNKVLF